MNLTETGCVYWGYCCLDIVRLAVPILEYYAVHFIIQHLWEQNGLLDHNMLSSQYDMPYHTTKSKVATLVRLLEKHQNPRHHTGAMGRLLKALGADCSKISKLQIWGCRFWNYCSVFTYYIRYFEIAFRSIWHTGSVYGVNNYATLFTWQLTFDI